MVERPSYRCNSFCHQEPGSQDCSRRGCRTTPWGSTLQMLTPGVLFNPEAGPRLLDERARTVSHFGADMRKPIDDNDSYRLS